jgi:hypothetical protein
MAGFNHRPEFLATVLEQHWEHQLGTGVMNTVVPLSPTYGISSAQFEMPCFTRPSSLPEVGSQY